ncbi:MAG TPA: hypothetical protein ENH64_09580 [Pseudomonas xinjiangensis]|uniref:Uncharacterized protein n=2 Tax=root TaxID=1 RepID=A0A7V1BPA4_9GAMM|nr:hypothetical protein [Halopseudomonas xinjiangensis]
MPFVAGLIAPLNADYAQGKGVFLSAVILKHQEGGPQMKTPEPEPLLCWSRDSSYGRLLRRIDQAMDLARTRQWLAGQSPGLTELEVSGLSKEDLQVLWRILDTLGEKPSLPNYISRSPLDETAQHRRHH